MRTRQLSDMLPDEVVKEKRPYLSRWGMGPCSRAAECGVCAMAHNLPWGEKVLIIIRNLYLDGVPVWVIGDAIAAVDAEVPSTEIFRHAHLKKWDLKRDDNLASIQKKIVWEMTLARFRRFRHLYTPHTPDRALELLAKMSGALSGEQVTAEAEVSWEGALVRSKVQKYIDVTPVNRYEQDA